MYELILLLILIAMLVYYFKFKTKHNIEHISVNTPVDAVYTYVNGRDKEWQKSKEKYMESDFNPQINNHDSIHPNRFRSMEELKYSLRSLEKFAPWIRTIYVVLANPDQAPSYLEERGNLHYVYHESCYRDIFT